MKHLKWNAPKNSCSKISRKLWKWWRPFLSRYTSCCSKHGWRQNPSQIFVETVHKSYLNRGTTDQLPEATNATTRQNLTIINGNVFLRIHWRLFPILKASNKSVWKNVFWYVKVCIFWKCIQMLKKIFFRQNKRYKKCPLFSFCELQLIIVVFLICHFYMSWSSWFTFLKMCVEFSIFDSVLFLLKFIFLSSKMHGLFNFKTSKSLSKLK